MAVNINQEMEYLGHVGARSYTPSDELIDQLISRTKRARAVRQGAVSVMSVVGTLALGAAAVQAVNAAKDDPAFRDRNLINDRSQLTPIEKFRAQYGNDLPSRTLESTVDIDKIYQELKAAAQANAELKDLEGQGDETAGSAADCTAKDHPSKAYKVWDCAKGDWVVKSGWYYDKHAGDYYQCSSPYSHPFGYYDCKKGKWRINNGWFEFGDKVFQIITWKDKATGQTSTGNYIPDYDKMAFAAPGTNWADGYRHLEGNATWNAAAQECVGVTKTIKNAPFQFSCLKDEQITHDNGSGGKVAKNWILKDNRYMWHSGHQKYYCIDAPPSGWTWDGSQWVETPPPSPAP